ncbi:MAG: PIN domain-containing protein [Bryobacterales bacterium]|nr:PIN domain-containing protein [Bryobacterales bacterium]
MSLFVDTSVWSLALRRDSPPDVPEVGRLRDALVCGETVCTTGLVLQELLQGFHGPRDGQRIIDLFADIAMIVPTRNDHIDAAILRNACRRRGIQVGTIDALLAHVCIRHGLVMLTTDRDFGYIAGSTSLRLWRAV